MKKSVSIHVTGRVQNVGFRYYTQKKAIELGVRGFVKNRPDGSVYIEAEAEEGPLGLFIHWCSQGPAWARVDEAIVQAQPVQNFQDFLIA